MSIKNTPPPTQRALHIRLQRGVSLIELMVSLTIGLLIAAALVTLFSNVSVSNNEQFKAAQQLENGRYAMELMGNDMRHAGFYGDFGYLPAFNSAAITLPDPCDTALFPSGRIESTTATSPLSFYIQTYTPASLTAFASIPTACATWIDGATLAAGSDIMVIRRLDTSPLIDPSGTPPVTSATPTLGQLYVQTKETVMDVQRGAGTVIDTSKNARGDVSDVDMMRKDFSQAAAPNRPLIAAYIRKLRVHVYFVAKCRKGSGSNGKCTAGDDTIPTLKRLELAVVGGVPSMTLVPLVDGIEYLRVYLGIDTEGNDGQVDGALTSQPATLSDWQNVTQVEIRLLARNVDSSSQADTKTYDLGNGNSFTPSLTAPFFKRHAYTQQIYITNIAGRREK